MSEIRLFKDKRSIKLETRKYPAGEVYVRVDEDAPNVSQQCVISAHIDDSEGILQLLMLTDAIRRQWGHIEIVLSLPYVPYGRHDRVMQQGEPLALKVFCDLINSQGYAEVILYDPHSDVTGALLDNVTIVPQEKIVLNIPLNTQDMLLVVPDAGAVKKSYAITSKSGFQGVLYAGKVRDIKSGNIVGVSGDAEQITSHKGSFLIVDDICDGGRSFTELARHIRKFSQGRIYLYVTHGIFSKGFTELQKDIHHIYTTVYWPKDRLSVKEFVTIIDQPTKGNYK